MLNRKSVKTLLLKGRSDQFTLGFFFQQNFSTMNKNQQSFDEIIFHKPRNLQFIIFYTLHFYRRQELIIFNQP